MRLLSTKEIKEIKSILANPKRIVIVTHRNPDGDAMGSSLGMYHYFIQLQHTVNVITPNDYPVFLHWLNGNEKVIEYKKETGKVKTLIEEAEVIFCLDFTGLKRIDEIGTMVQESHAVKIHIDHHQHPEYFADYLFSDTQRASTAELVYEFILLLGGKQKINKYVATCLYTGIMTDTASFRYASTNAKTHHIVADLINRGANNAAIFDLIYENNSENKIRFLGYCLLHKLKVYPEFNTAIIVVDKEELQKFNNKKGDTEGFVNYALSINGISFAAFFVERPDRVKVSFRSKGTFCVNQFAKKHFNGGGHSNAAGGETTLPLQETVNLFLSLLPEYEKELTV